MKVRYGTGIDTLAKVAVANTTSDPSQDVLVSLAMAYAAMKRLEAKGVDITLNGEPLVLPFIQRAYREAVHLRKEITEDWIDESLLTRGGRLVDGKG